MRCFYCMDEECKNMSFTWHVKVSVVSGTLMSRGSLFQAVEAKWLEGRFLTVICSYCILQSCVYTLHRIMMVYRNQLNCVLLSPKKFGEVDYELSLVHWFLKRITQVGVVVCVFICCMCLLPKHWHKHCYQFVVHVPFHLYIFVTWLSNPIWHLPIAVICTLSKFSGICGRLHALMLVSCDWQCKLIYSKWVVSSDTAMNKLSPVQAPGCKNGPIPFWGQALYKVTKPGFSFYA